MNKATIELMHTIRRPCLILSILFLMLVSILNANEFTGVVRDVRFINRQWICVVLDQTPDILKSREQQYGAVLNQQWTAFQNNPADWKYPLSLKYHTLSIIAEQRPPWIRLIENPQSWRIQGKVPLSVNFWPQSVDGFPAWNPNFPPSADYIALPRIADFVYLKLPAPLKNQETLSIRCPNGKPYSLAYNESSCLSWAIKINQLGYLPDAPQKFAYLGFWLGSAGPLDLSTMHGKPFYLHSLQNGLPSTKSVFKGIIRLRSLSKNNYFQNQPVSGEDVYELDFSAFHQPGNYCLLIPGMGRSREFRIANDIYGPAFYTIMRGLYHQRCGVELKPPYTTWTRPACHLTTYRGGFLPESQKWYENDQYSMTSKEGTASFGFRNSDNHPLKLGAFQMVAATASDEVIDGLKGGWHDAADFDRRIHHLKVAWDLCGVYEMFPQKFTDNQLNIPESGNHIPDILDEAAVPIEFLIKTQRIDGGISSWAEQTRHPNHRFSPELDPNPFYLSLPDRLSSLQYAAAAAYLGRLITPFAPQRGQRYIYSARRAYAFGINPSHRLTGIQFSQPNKWSSENIRFDENLVLPGPQGNPGTNPDSMLAAMQLYAATTEQTYLDAWNTGNGIKTFSQCLPDGIHPFAFVTPLLHPEWFGNNARHELLLSMVTGETKVFLQGQQALPYRNLWRSPEHPYFPLMAWGNVHSTVRARFSLIAWRLTGNESYRQAAILGADWELGCNELGRSFITGLGSQYPVVLQHIQSEKDHWLEPVPGIIPFTFTYGIARSALNYQFGLLDESNPTVSDYFRGTALCWLPVPAERQQLQSLMNDIYKNGQGYQKSDGKNKMGDMMKETLMLEYPIFRRQYIHPFMEPGQNEFTVYETIGPTVALFGALLPDAWSPDSTLLHREPIQSPQQLPMYLQP